MGGEGRASAFARLVGEQQEIRAVEDLAALGFDGEIAALRVVLLSALREIDDPLNRAIAVSKLAEALARVQASARAASPGGGRGARGHSEGGAGGAGRGGVTAARAGAMTRVMVGRRSRGGPGAEGASELPREDVRIADLFGGVPLRVNAIAR